MRILSITAGAASMYCGSCLRDNALAAELLARGHDVTLIPLYTTLLTDEANVTEPRVLFGGISIYLQQRSAWFRRLPRFVERLLDSPWLIKTVADRSVSTDPKLLGDLTISMLEGTDGVLRREFDKLVEWAAAEPRPDVVNITNSMLISLARPLAEALHAPVCCTLQGEDLFLEGLVEPHRSRALDLIRRRVGTVDQFIAVSEFYARFMKSYLHIPAARMNVVPLGINLKSFEDAEGAAASAPKGASAASPKLARDSRERRREDAEAKGGGDRFTVGYFARIAPEKGLQVLADAFVRLRRRTGAAPIRLEAAGYLAAADKPYLLNIERSLERAGLRRDFTYRGAVDRAGKVKFLSEVDVLSVPATYDEPKGFSLLEAMACGVPVVQPRRGSFTEIVETTGGGLLVEPDNANGADALADGLYRLWQDPALRAQLGRRGHAGVRAHYTIERSADRLLQVYERLKRPRRETTEVTKATV